jgi:hypothetical protein
MALWVKALLWIAVVLLPGGLLLLPVLVALHGEESARSETSRGEPAEPAGLGGRVRRRLFERHT